MVKEKKSSIIVLGKETGLWEEIYNQDFKPVEFDGIKNSSSLDSFSLTLKRGIGKTNVDRSLNGENVFY